MSIRDEDIAISAGPVKTPVTAPAAPPVTAFPELWPGGYFEGDPLDPMASSTYGPLGYVSVLHATYLACIKPYVTDATVALEIGPGRGAWTRTMLHAREIWAVDVAPASQTGFHDYVGAQPHVRYVQARDYGLGELPDGHFDYFFSFGCFCHVPFEGIAAYVERLWHKLVPGAHGFMQVADYAQYNRWLADAPRLTVGRAFSRGRRALPVRLALGATQVWRPPYRPREPDTSDAPAPARWYDAGRDHTCRMLMETGFEILDPDVGTVVRDPIVHFRKPLISY